METNLIEIYHSYIQAILFTEEELEGETVDNFDSESVAKIWSEITSFVKQAGELLPNGLENQIGHDFWLTRNGHGTGFWDRPEYYGDNCDELSEIATKFGESYAYIGDNGKVYVQ